MRHSFSTSILLVSIVVASADSTINPDHPFAYSPNTGWLNAQGDGANGTVLGEYVCSGFIWGANVGWIHLGDGTPANGIHYQNNAASDFGVNHDGLGNLRGYAYGANIGWVQFENQGAPRFSLRTGQLSGYAWSANCGWISLSNAVAHVQTDTLRPGIDSDGDGIADGWELSYTNSLGALTASTDTDGDGASDVDEYGADTNPLNADDLLRITDHHVEFDGENDTDTVTWTSRPTRAYVVQSGTVLDPPPFWANATPVVEPDAGSETMRSIPFPSSSPQRFFRVQALQPLTP